MNTPTHRTVLALVAGLGLAGLIVSWYALSRVPPRPQLPNAVPAVLEAERRVEHVYMIHVLGASGPQGPWVCEPANVGVQQVKR